MTIYYHQNGEMWNSSDEETINSDFVTPYWVTKVKEIHKKRKRENVRRGAIKINCAIAAKKRERKIVNMVGKAKQKEDLKKRVKAMPSDKGKMTYNDQDCDKKRAAMTTPPSQSSSKKKKTSSSKSPLAPIDNYVTPGTITKVEQSVSCSQIDLPVSQLANQFESSPPSQDDFLPPTIVSSSSNTITSMSTVGSNSVLPNSMMCNPDEVIRTQHRCTGCGYLFDGCYEMKYRLICLQFVLDYVDDIGRLENTTDDGVRIAYHKAFLCCVRKDLMEKTSYFETNRLLPIPKCMIVGSLKDALDMTNGRNDFLLKVLTSKRIKHVESTLRHDELARRFVKEE